jgi:ATP synthase subunit K
MATLGTTAVTAWFFTGGKKAAGNEPPINATSKEEESFVK